MFLIALTLLAAEPDERWVVVAGGGDGRTESVDMESIQRTGDKVTLWTRRSLAPGPGTLWNELEFDCRTKTQSVLAFIRDDAGTISHNVARPHRAAAPIPAGTLADKIFKIACR